MDKNHIPFPSEQGESGDLIIKETYDFTDQPMLDQLQQANFTPLDSLQNQNSQPTSQPQASGTISSDDKNNK